MLQENRLQREFHDACQSGDREVVEYAGVASFRSYHYFNETKDTTLDLLHCRVSQDIINNNRLLDIKANRIHFMFEKPQEKNYGN